MRDVFVLGAGFSKAISTRMPTIHELSSRVMPHIRRHDSSLADRLAKLGHNVELWMTYLSQDQPWLRVEENQHNLSVASRIRRDICAVVTERTLQAVSGEPPKWLEQLLRIWHDRQSVVITLNYDTLVERVARGLWVPSERPTEPDEDPELNEIHLANLYPPYLTFVGGRSGYAVGAPLPRSTFTLLKLHGSTNWYYSGRPDFYGENILYADVPVFGDATAGDEGRRADKETLIIPPVTEKTTYFRNETVNRVWLEAADALSTAERVFVIGYSLPPSDLGMRLFLTTVRRDPLPPFYIVDIDPKVAGRYQKALHLDVSTSFIREEDAVAQFANHYTSGF